jgi:hypothetical protein
MMIAAEMAMISEMNRPTMQVGSVVALNNAPGSYAAGSA